MKSLLTIAESLNYSNVMNQIRGVIARIQDYVIGDARNHDFIDRVIMNSFGHGEIVIVQKYQRTKSREAQLLRRKRN